jgi:NADH-quinone oxidoreductase subunit F
MTSVIGAPNAKETRIITKRLRDRPEDSWTLDGFIQSGGYEAFRAALKLDPEAIGAEQVAAAGLRGRGGAGFPTGTKWSFLPKDSYPRYLVVNGDEGEPSTFKDRMLIENDPHQLIEGIAIASYAIGCNLAFIYVRGEFALGFERLVEARRDAIAAGFLGTNILGSGVDLDSVIHRGAGG